MGAGIIVNKVSKIYSPLQIIDQWTLRIEPAERVVILGPSGAGKTSFLRMIGGLDEPSSGTLEVSSMQVGFVFQEPRLIPWRTVRQNLLFVNQEGDVEGVLERLKLAGFADYLPAQLSGGMQQRVNLARALIMDPQLLILDEAFSSLDLPVKMDIIQDITKHWQDKQFTLVAVTHDLKEALSMADRIVIVSGRPSRIIHDFAVNLDMKDRDITEPKLLALESRLLSIISANR